ncbi:WD40 repeat-like protein [Hymenopellis radicata]|nr:WD40 repeat-like protein [Hymenopellis radicata]
MAKHGRKRQRVAKDESKGPNPLLDDASKDDEERRLESLLFGTPYIPSGSNNVIEIEDDEVDAGKEFQNLDDADLFFVDDKEVDEEDSGEEKDEGDGDSDSDESEEEEKDETVPPNPLSRPRKAAAWSDPSDPPSVSIESNQLRKLRDAPSETVLSGREYESRLRRQFERINPAPSWARKRRRDEDEDEDDVDNLLSSTTGILSQKRRPTLASGTIAIERLRDANQASQKSNIGDVKSIVFHPSDRVPVLAVGTGDRRVRLYNIDGHTSPLLQTLHIPSLPLTSISFHPSGSHLLLAGTRPTYSIFDLQTGQVTNQTGLWGSRFSSASKDKPENMHLTAFSPGGGLLAVAGRNGNLHLVDWQSGGGQVVGTMKCPGSAGGGIKSLWWADDGTLATLTADAEVFLWDIGQRKCSRRWKDEGGFRGTGRTMSGCANWLAIGSNTGLVNVYESDSFAKNREGQPKTKKTLGNITTAISSMTFNHDAQLMAIASKEKKDSMKLIHFPSLTAFGNWPTSSTPVGHVTTIDFSPRSDYLAIGNTRGRVLLYHLKDYSVRTL